MAWKRLRKVALVVCCGGMVFQATSCQTQLVSQLVSMASGLLSSYVTEAILSGFLT